MVLSAIWCDEGFLIHCALFKMFHFYANEMSLRIFTERAKPDKMHYAYAPAHHNNNIRIYFTQKINDTQQPKCIRQKLKQMNQTFFISHLNVRDTFFSYFLLNWSQRQYQLWKFHIIFSLSMSEETLFSILFFNPSYYEIDSASFQIFSTLNRIYLHILSQITFFH